MTPTCVCGNLILNGQDMCGHCTAASGLPKRGPTAQNADSPWLKFRRLPLLVQLACWLCAYPIPLGLVVHHSIRQGRASKAADLGSAAGGDPSPPSTAPRDRGSRTTDPKVSPTNLFGGGLGLIGAGGLLVVVGLAFGVVATVAGSDGGATAGAVVATVGVIAGLVGLIPAFIGGVWGAGKIAAGAVEFDGMAYDEARRIMDDYRRRHTAEEQARRRAAEQQARHQHTTPPPPPPPRDPLQEYLDVLGIDRSATHQEVRAAWVELNFKLHPDRHMNEPLAHRQRLEEQLKKVNAAYAVLKEYGVAA